VAVERAGPVLTHRGSRIGVTGGFLNVAQRDAGVEGGGDERVKQRMGTDLLEDPCPSGDSPHDPGSAVTIETATGKITKDRTGAAFSDRKVDGPGSSRGEAGSWSRTTLSTSSGSDTPPWT